jgi:hypothetical protein
MSNHRYPVMLMYRYSERLRRSAEEDERTEPVRAASGRSANGTRVRDRHDDGRSPRPLKRVRDRHDD